MIQDRSFVSIVQWPKGAGLALREDIVRGCLDVDAHRAREWARRPAPAILARAPADRGARMVEELTGAGVQAIAVPGSAIAAHADPWLARAIAHRPAEGRLTVTRWRNGRDDRDLSVEFSARSILLLARGVCRDKASTPVGGDFGVEALHQLHGTFSAEDWSQGHTGRGLLRVVEALDVHTLEGPHWRFLGGRFTGGAPGSGNEPTAREQIDTLAVWLAHESGGQEIDRSFAQARFLAEFAPDFGVRGDWRSLAGFGVYSAWRRHLAMRRCGA